MYQRKISISNLNKVLLSAFFCAVVGVVEAQSVDANNVQSFVNPVSEVIPKGKTKATKQVQVRFKHSMINLGPNAVDPFLLSCNDNALKGEGKWTDTKFWQYDFSKKIDGGTQCTLVPNPEFRDLNNKPLTDNLSYRFVAGVPQIEFVLPDETNINEDQFFILQSNTPMQLDSLKSKGFCVVDGIGERLPIKLLSTQEQDAFLSNINSDQINGGKNLQVVSCGRRLPAGAEVKVIFSEGVQAQNGASTAKPYSRVYRVQEPFRATVSCQRLKQNLPCLPITPIDIEFNANVEPKLLGEIRLKVDDKILQPLSESLASDSDTDSVSFNAPNIPKGQMQVLFPDNFRDDSGRVLSNLEQFAKPQLLDDFPPLAKFAAGKFGIYEKYTQVQDQEDASKPQADYLQKHPALVPLTIRKVSKELVGKEFFMHPGQVQDYVALSDVDVMAWLERLSVLDETQVTAAELKNSLDLKSLIPDQQTSNTGDDEKSYDTRSISVLDKEKSVQSLELPALSELGSAETQVIGLPLRQNGLHVLELKSALLGKALLEKPAPMYVRTAALLTNMGVHMKYSAEDFLVWVTTLDHAQPVAGAKINVLDCNARILASGITDEQGRFYINKPLKASSGQCRFGYRDYFVSAQIGADHPMARGEADYSFALSDWQQGIESWRFGFYGQGSDIGNLLEHTFLSRTLLRAGEMVTMKHYIRAYTKQGLGLPAPEKLPDQVRLNHVGSDDTIDLPIKWSFTPSGGMDADNMWSIPKTAKLGKYNISFLKNGEEVLGSNASFRVEEFKLPLLTGSMKLSDDDNKTGTLINPKRLTLDMQLNYVGGGAAANTPVKISAMSQLLEPVYKDYDEYDFSTYVGDDDSGNRNVFLKEATLQLNSQGHGVLDINKLPSVTRPASFVFEANYMDPNGQVQTLQQRVKVLPSALVLGTKYKEKQTDDKANHLQVVVLDVQGRPQVGKEVVVTGRQYKYISVRKRLVGGFYTYDSHKQENDLGELCRGISDAKGKFDCELQQLQDTVRVTVSAHDAQQRLAQISQNIYLLGDGSLDGDANNDRIDIIANQKSYSIGDTASFQVRMPFQQATALVAVERGGILTTQVQQLTAKDPVVRLKVEKDWTPNVYVSVLVVRGRVYVEDQEQGVAYGKSDPQDQVRGLIDLSKPSFRYGITQVNIKQPQNNFDLRLTLDKPVYQLREYANLKIKGTLPDGKPAAHATVAVAVVDQSLLELSGNNDSFDIFAQMLKERGYGVELATAQSEVVGRRHFGRKAVPAGGGGGNASGMGTREFFDSLLLWHPRVELDAQGEATVPIHLNDTISEFKVFALGDYGPEQFSQATSALFSTKDLQLISGLPLVIRNQDQFQAMVTVRNASKRSMRLQVKGQSQGFLNQSLPTQEFDLAANQSKVLNWNIQMRQGASMTPSGVMNWLFEANELGGEHNIDRLKISQNVLHTVPITVRQAETLQLDAQQPPKTISLALPEQALAINGKPLGQVNVQTRTSLAGGLETVEQWFRDYPYTCFEQQVSVYIGTNDQRKWQGLMQQLPVYLDKSGFLRYFPSDRMKGSPILTSLVLSVSAHAKGLGLDFSIPEPYLGKMLQGLKDFVDGKVKIDEWSPRPELYRQQVQIQALATLSQYGMVTEGQVRQIDFDKEDWTMPDLINWQILTTNINSDWSRQLQPQIRQRLLIMLDRKGQLLIPRRNELTETYWMLTTSSANLARLLLVVAEDKNWQEDIPYMVQGLMSKQERGTWQSTNGNLLATLALKKHAKVFEQQKPKGDVKLALSSTTVTKPAEQTVTLDQTGHIPWLHKGQQDLSLQLQGEGKVWATVSAMGSVPLTKATYAGYEIARQLTPLLQQVPGQWSVGDIYKVVIKVKSSSDMNWVVVNDPVPAGATILGSGLGRDSEISQISDSADAADEYVWGRGPWFVERKQDSYRAYYGYMSEGETQLTYTVRLNTEGQFSLPPTRVEAMYAPDVYGELPNGETFSVKAK